MKIKTKLYASLLMASAFVTNLTEANPGIPDEHLPRQVNIYVEKIEITALEYAKMMTVPKTNNNHTAMRNVLLEKVHKGEAKLISNQSLITRSGERATVESIREFIYPTEYELAVEVIAKDLPKKGETPKAIAKSSHLPPTPNAFETRNLGETLEVEPILGADGKTINLTFKPKSVKHVGDYVMANWKTKDVEMKVQMPIFYTTLINTSLIIINGEFLLATTYTPETDGKVDHSRKVLQFVRAEILVARGAK